MRKKPEEHEHEHEDEACETEPAQPIKYSSNVMEHFLHPHNMGEIINPDGEGQVGNMVCGDIMKIQIKVKDNKIQDIKFKTLGCAAAISSTSVLTDLAKGKTLEEAIRITREDVVKELGGLPAVKIHCSVLAQDALKKAIKDYESKKK